MIGILLLAPVAESATQWRRVGSAALETGLAGPAGGAVDDVSFSLDGSLLLVRLPSGLEWVSDDRGASWRRPAAREASLPRIRPLADDEILTPRGDAFARVYRHPLQAGRAFALGRELWTSPDEGRSWIRLSAAEPSSLIGSAPRALAFDPSLPDALYVANRSGLWRSLDGGASWAGLNEKLPNFPSARFSPGVLAGPGLVTDLGEFELTRLRGVETWLRMQTRREAPVLERTGSEDRFAVSASGRIVVSPDGRAFRTVLDSQLPPSARGRRAASLWTSSQRPLSAVAALAGAGPSRLLRSVDGGEIWDDVTGDLPAGELHAVAASIDSEAIYVAGEQGVFYAMADLSAPGPASSWRKVAGNLPEAAVEDLYLDASAGLLYALVRGEGVYRARAPAVADRLLLLNSADLSRRPVAPGGLLTVRGDELFAAEVSGLPAPVLAQGEAESQIQVPFGATGPEMSLSLSTPSGARILRYPLEEASPAIFVDSSGPLVLDAASGRLLDLGRPARPGSRILVLATGLGRTRPDWPAGIPAPLDNPPRALASVSANLNGAELPVISSILAPGFIGAYLVELDIPRTIAPGIGDLVLRIGRRESNPVRVFVAPLD